MKIENCDDVLMAAMALADGEEAALSEAQVDTHLAGCEACRLELELAGEAVRVLEARGRRIREPDLWPGIEKRISAGAAPSTLVFWALGAVLVGYKLIELLPEEAPAYAYRIVPLIIVAAAFIFIRENPFKIKTELILEK